MILLFLWVSNLLMGQGSISTPAIGGSFSATSGFFSFDIRKKNQPARPAYTSHALLIANSDYDDRQYPVLPNCVYDVDSLKKLLESRFSFTVDFRLRATEQDFIAELERLKKRRWQRTDQLLIYIAGHGGFDPITQDGFLVMRNASRAERTHLFPMASLKQFLKTLTCEHVLLILDVCYGGTFDEAIALEKTVVSNKPPSLPPPPPTDNRRIDYVRDKLKPRTRILLASGGKEPVNEGRAKEHSPFARALFTHLDKTAGVKGNILSIYELKTALENDLPSVVVRTFEGNEPNSDFLFYCP